jgi:hypothetical protein
MSCGTALYLLHIAAAHTGTHQLHFHKPVLIRQSTVVSPNLTTHAWFPEGGAVVGVQRGQGGQAVVASVRFTNDGGKSPSALPHLDESFVSWDSGRSWGHFDFLDHDLTPTVLDRHGVLHGSCCFTRNSDNHSFSGANVTWTAVNKALIKSESASRNSVVYSGFPFPVARFTYMGAAMPTYAPSSIQNFTPDGRPTELAQTVAFSFELNEANGPDENLAAFRSTDGGSRWHFQQIIALKNETEPPASSRWEGPGENDIVRLQDGTLLTVFRVDSCHPYWHSRSTDRGKSWSAPTVLSGGVNGSARPKLALMPNGQPLLAGGRPGLFLWLGNPSATPWRAVNVAAVHNSLTADEPAWQYAPGFVDGSAVGAPCAPDIPAGTTSYTSLMQTGPSTFLLEYDRLGNVRLSTLALCHGIVVMVVAAVVMHPHNPLLTQPCTR